MNLQILKDELTADPLNFGYAPITDAQAAIKLNDNTTGRTLSVDTLQAVVIYEAIDPDEFNLLDGIKKEAIDRILSLSGNILVTPGSKARKVIITAFGPSTATRDALLIEVTRIVSRGEELGIGLVKVGHVQMARL